MGQAISFLQKFEDTIFHHPRSLSLAPLKSRLRGHTWARPRHNLPCDFAHFLQALREHLASSLQVETDGVLKGLPRLRLPKTERQACKAISTLAHISQVVGRLLSSKSSTMSAMHMSKTGGSHANV
eukprot:1011111-Pleurochrysis_carterae.AAC.1